MKATSYLITVENLNKKLINSDVCLIDFYLSL